MTARPGMTDLIADLRERTEAGSADYQVNGVQYWTDEQLQVALDAHRTDVFRSEIAPVQEYNGGTVVTTKYYSPFGNFEATSGGTAVFVVQDAAGSAIGTASYTVDYRRGAVEFGADTGGSTYAVTGRSYDLNRAAADVWRRKAGHYAHAYDISTDNHRLSRSQLKAHCVEMASYYSGQAGPTSISLERSDC